MPRGPQGYSQYTIPGGLKRPNRMQLRECGQPSDTIANIRKDIDAIYEAKSYRGMKPALGMYWADSASDRIRTG